jgi:hypothetical protein
MILEVTSIKTGAANPAAQRQEITKQNLHERRLTSALIVEDENGWPPPVFRRFSGKIQSKPNAASKVNKRLGGSQPLPVDEPRPSIFGRSWALRVAGEQFVFVSRFSRSAKRNLHARRLMAALIS